MITAPVAREQWLRLVVAYRHPIDARAQLADHLDTVAASLGDRYYNGLADALRLPARFTAPATAQIWN